MREVERYVAASKDGNPPSKPRFGLPRNKMKVAFQVEPREMALIDAGTRRTATVVALNRSVVLRIDEPSFTRIADRHPSLWRNLAIEMVRRLADLQTRCKEGPEYVI